MPGGGSGAAGSPSTSVPSSLPCLTASMTLSSTGPTRSSFTSGNATANLSKTKSGTGTLLQSLAPTPDILVTSDKPYSRDDEDPIGGNVCFNFCKI